MVKKIDDLPYPHAGLGLTRLAWGFVNADGTKAGEMSRGCIACNREEGRSSASQALTVELPLDQESGRGDDTAKAIAQVVIDYCPRCGRIYDVRCSARR